MIGRRVGLGAALGVLVGCGARDVTVKSVTGPAGEAAYVIGCDKGPELCAAEANRLCPKGHRTLEPGKGGYFKEALGPSRATAEPHPGDVYRQFDWVIACD
ncbi:MAG TPA: hypothetical protein VHB21_11110 [Minicystis sp.]|nr:hypothetical protein [Minicystis sp.]